MKLIITIIGLALAQFVASGQKVISFNTSYYGKKEIYRELYVSSDSVFLKEHELSKKDTHRLFTMPNRQDFLYVDQRTFKTIFKCVMRENKNISQIDFPKPFAEIYFIKFYDYKRKKTVITSAFGRDDQVALNYFVRFEKQLEAEKVSETFIQKLDAIISSLEIKRK